MHRFRRFPPPSFPPFPPFPPFPIPLVLAHKEPTDVEFNINMTAKDNSKLTTELKTHINSNISGLKTLFETIIKELCDSKNLNKDILIVLDELIPQILANPVISELARKIVRGNDLIVIKASKFIQELYDRKDIKKLCSLNHSIKILVGGGNRSNNIDIDLKKILSEKYDIESLNKESNFYNYNVEWMNSRKEFQNLIYKLLKPKSIDMFFDSMSKSMKLLDSVVLDKNKYSVYKHLYKLYQDKKMKNSI
jgi:hypothetical protein